MILPVSLTIGVISGFLMHRSDYCVTGMFRDAIMFRQTFMLRALFLQIVITMVLFEVLRLGGALPFYPFPLIGKPSLANLIGGIVFGVGMVLAGGCVVGTLYKMGAGSVASMFAFIGLIVGSGLYAEIHPSWAAFAKATTFADAVTLPQLLETSPTLLIAVISIPSLALFRRWRQQHLWEKNTMVAGYIQPWKTALMLTLLGAISYILLGMPLGISTTYAKIAAFIENILSPEHVTRIAYFQGIPLDVVHPLFNSTLRGGAGPAFDTIWHIQFPLIIGITGGSAVSALLLGEFALRYKIPSQQLFMALLGGAIMGFGARMAAGCNVWHLMGGIPILATRSLLFLIGLPIGTWFGSKVLFALLTRQTTSSCRE